MLWSRKLLLAEIGYAKLELAEPVALRSRCCVTRRNRNQVFTSEHEQESPLRKQRGDWLARLQVEPFEMKHRIW